MELKAYYDLQKNYSTLKIIISSSLADQTEILLAPHSHLLLTEKIHSTNRGELLKLIEEIEDTIKNFEQLLAHITKIEADLSPSTN